MRAASSALAGGLLVLVHVVLAVWAVVGLIEMIADVPWPRLSNPLFLPAVLLAQWLSILLASFLFIGGNLRRWRFTPHAMVGAYLLMALVCAWQTLDYLVHDTRFLQMGIEYMVYTAILLYLFKAPAMREHFRLE